MTSIAARAKAAELQQLRDELKSWRKVQKIHYPAVNFATLNRIALSEGKWLPKDKQILRVLGLTKVKPEPLPGERRVKRKIAEMAKRTKEAVLR